MKSAYAREFSIISQSKQVQLASNENPKATFRKCSANNPCCERCGTPLPDWCGNLIVDTRDYFHRNPSIVKEISVICKNCTQHLSPQRYHAIYELEWLFAEPESVLENVRESIESGSVCWYAESLEKIVRLAHGFGNIDFANVWLRNDSDSVA